MEQKEIELINHIINKKTLKSGFKELFLDLKEIKQQHKTLTTILLLFFIVGFVDVRNFMSDNNFAFVGAFFLTEIITPIAAVILLQQKATDIQAFFLQLFNKIKNLRLYIILFVTIFCIYIGLAIPVISFLNDTGLTANESLAAIHSILELNMQEYNDNITLEPHVIDFFNKVTEMDQTKIIINTIIGFIIVIFSLIIGFFSVIICLNFDYISVKDSFKLSIIYNFKNGLYILSKTFGILILIGVSAFIESPMFEHLFGAILITYTYYVIVNMIKHSVFEKEI